MEKLSDVVTRLQPKPSDSMQPSSGPSQIAPISQDLAGRESLALILGQCFQALNLYGKEPEQIEAAIALHQMVLSDYSIDQIRPAFVKWLQINNTFPAPADIVSLIRRGGKPPLDRAVYVAISKKPGDQRTSADWEYMRDYEKSMMEG